MPSTSPYDAAREAALRTVAKRISEVEYGEVLVVVHQGQVTEVQVTKKERLATQETPKP